MPGAPAKKRQWIPPALKWKLANRELASRILVDDEPPAVATVEEPEEPPYELKLPPLVMCEHCKASIEHHKFLIKRIAELTAACKAHGLEIGPEIEDEGDLVEGADTDERPRMAESTRQHGPEGIGGTDCGQD